MASDEEKGLALLLLAGELGDFGSALAQGRLSARLFNMHAVVRAVGSIADRITAGDDVSRAEMRRLLSAAAHQPQQAEE